MDRYSRDTHYFSAVQLHQVLADPQSQARSAAALQIVAIELCELVEHLGLILDRYSYIQSRRKRNILLYLGKYSHIPFLILINKYK